MTVIGFLHPGAMGVSLAATCGGDRVWASEGRSPATAERATGAGLRDVGGLAALVDEADVIVSICPPSAAVDQAQRVATLGYDGVYVDANAISPSTARDIGGRFARFVDGGVVGPPVSGPGSTRLYVSGAHADADVVAACWDGSDLEVRIVDGGAGAASAVKVAYAAWTKGSSALLLAVRAFAEAEGVSADLVAEWETSLPHLVADVERRAARVSPKAWRWVGEMEEISAAFDAAGLPGEFHVGAGELYRRLAGFKDTTPGPELDPVIDALLSAHERGA